MCDYRERTDGIRKSVAAVVSYQFIDTFPTVLLLFLFLLLWLLLFPMINVAYFHISTSRSTFPVPNMTVFSSSLMTCFPCTFLSLLPELF
jgi:hypothetical protein